MTRSHRCPDCAGVTLEVDGIVAEPGHDPHGRILVRDGLAYLLNDREAHQARRWHGNALHALHRDRCPAVREMA